MPKQHLSTKWIGLLVLAVLLAAMIVPALAVSAQGPELIELPAVDPLSVSGDIITAGSSTVGPLSERIAEQFRNEGYADNITIDIIGSGAGFERFCTNAETDISNASRPIKDSEVEACRVNGREPIEFRVGTDGVAVVVSKANDFATDVTLDELALIFSTAETWADVRPEWPAEPILRFIPGTDSGTFDFFTEVVFESDEGPILSADNLQLSEDDNVLVQGVEGSPYAIGFFGYAYYQENADALNVLALEGVTPNAETVEAFVYPLARPLFLYSTAQIMNDKPQVAAFLDYYLTQVNDVISSVGYFPASNESLNGARQSWLDAMGMGLVELPAVDPLSVSGDIITAGSSTVGPLSERIAEQFRNEGYADNITIDIIGSGAGFERFCTNAETDISNASRPIKDSEVEACRANGREPIEFRVGTDGVAVVVSKANDFATDVTLDELALIFSTAETWADVRPEWPAEPILRFIPGTDSGTFDFFTEVVFESDEGPILSADNLQLSEDDNVLVQGVEGSPYAIGFFGYAYYQENADALNVLALEGVTPNAETVEAFVYPLARPLFLYSTAQIMNDKPQVAAFLDYYLTQVNDVISSVGYFPASNESLNGARQSWLDAMGGM